MDQWHEDFEDCPSSEELEDREDFERDYEADMDFLLERQELEDFRFGHVGVEVHLCKRKRPTRRHVPIIPCTARAP